MKGINEAPHLIKEFSPPEEATGEYKKRMGNLLADIEDYNAPQDTLIDCRKTIDGFEEIWHWMKDWSVENGYIDLYTYLLMIEAKADEEQENY